MPCRTGKISLKEGDDLEQLAKNFCRSYHLNKDMQKELYEQLQAHLKTTIIKMKNQAKKTGKKASK